MNEPEARQAILSRINVTRQHVVRAKAHILANFQKSTADMLRKLLRDVDAQKPIKLVLNPSISAEPQVAQAAQAITWQLAFGEAVWGLIGAGIMMPTRTSLDRIDANLEWTTVVPGSGGTSSGWRFEEYDIHVPTEVCLAPSVKNGLPQPLSDPDIYLSDFGIQNLHAEVEDALRQAALCFRHELYVPCLAMLAKASEGAWVELGISLLKVNPDHSGLKPERRSKIRETLESQYSSTLQKMEEVAQLYEKQDVFDGVSRRSGYSHRHLKGVLNWSNVVRDSRNAVHYGADPATQNTYEKVAALLLGAVPNIKIIYSIRQAAEELAVS
jgi:hypothetical protein